MTTSGLLACALACAIAAAACGVLNILTATRRSIVQSLLAICAVLMALSIACDNNIVLAGAAAAPLAIAVAGLSMRTIRGWAGIRAVIHPDSAAAWGPAFAEGVQVAAANLDMEKARAAVRAYWDKREQEGNEAARKLDDKDWNAARVVAQCAHEFCLNYEAKPAEPPKG